MKIQYEDKVIEIDKPITINKLLKEEIKNRRIKREKYEMENRHE